MLKELIIYIDRYRYDFSPENGWVCVLVLCLVLYGIADFFDDLQQPPGHELDQGLQVLGVKVAFSIQTTENSCNLVITGPINVNFSDNGE